MRIRVVVDSTCDIPKDLLEKYAIRVLPAYIQFGLESFKDDGINITQEEFYRRLRTSNINPTTAAFPPGEAEEVYRELLREADHIISVHLASKLSGIFASAKLAADTIAPDKITVIDTGLVSMAAGWLGIMAAELAEQGIAPSKIAEEVSAASQRATLWAAPETLESLRKSGRISWLTAGMGGLLQIKPIVMVKDGVVLHDGRVRTFKNALKELTEKARQEAPLERLAILHLDNPTLAEQMCDILSDIAPPNTRIVWASSAVASHFGPGGLGVATVRKTT